MMRGMVCGIGVGLILGGSASGQAPDKPLQLAAREPAFYAIVGTHIERAEAGSFAALRGHLDLRLHNVTIPEALKAIENQTWLKFAYQPSVLPGGATVSLDARDITVAAALTQILLDAHVDVEIAPYGLATLVARNHLVGRQPPGDTITVSGVITDSTTHGPLSGAVVRVVGGTQGATSGSDGAYTIKGLSPGTYHLVVRRLGYSAATVDVTAPNAGAYTRNIALVLVPTVLDQVVTTVTGNQQLKSIGNTIATINADSLVPNTPVTTLSDVINARAVGVQVINPGGLTGASPVVYIRGAGSLSRSTQPLLYVDGVRVSNGYSGSPTFGGGTAGSFNDVSPEDIASIEVVKGPSAATLYGTDAANGVILITTKHGQAGSPRWNVFTEGGALTVNDNPIPLNYTGWGHSGGQITNACTLVSVAAGNCVQDSVTSFSPLRVPSLTPLGTGNRGEVGMQVSGGGVRALRYFVSGDYTSEVGPIKDPQVDQRVLDSLVGPLAGSGSVKHPNSVTKYDGRVNLITPTGGNADISVTANYLSQTTRIPSGGLLLDAAGGAGYRDQYNGWAFGSTPAYLFSLMSADNTQHFTGSVAGHWIALPWLTARGSAGVDVSSDGFTEFQPPAAAPIDFNPGGMAYDQRGNTTLYSVDLGATTRVPLGSRLVANTSVGAQYHRADVAIATASATNLTPGARNVSGGTAIGAQIDSQNVVAGVYAEEQLALNDRLFVTGAVRIDGANDFGHEFRSAVYPKAGISWLVSKESLFRSLDWLSLWRLRAAYGESGTQPGLVLTTLSSSPVTIDGAQQTGLTLSTIGNSRVQPERQKEIEMGSDIDLVDSRLHLEFTYYSKRNVNALYSVPLGASLGTNIGSLEENIGEIRNWGYEAMVSAAVVSTKPFSWDVSFNGSINHNQVTTLGPYFQASYGQFGNPSVVAGFPLWAMFAQPYSYRDANGNGIIESDEVTVSGTQRYLGPTIPSRQLTAATHIGLFDNRVRVGVQFDYRGDFVIPNQYAAAQCANTDAFASIVRSARLAAQAGCLAYSVGSTNYAFVSDGSFIRFRELSLTFTAPDRVAQRVRARTLSVTLSARNLALWTHFSGGDPESAPQTLGVPQEGVFSRGGGIPAVQYWLARVNLGF